MSAPRPGLVSIVGAGPGSLDHVTLKAAHCLREADLVLYDALVAAEVLTLAERAEHVFVGKRAAGVHTPQAAIHELMIAEALAGRRVVRLKGGDPFVFGRGSEEALALQAAGVRYEIVPGVSAAIAAPALAGIPVTHRGTSSGVVVLTGADRSTCDKMLDRVPPGLVTIVLMMSLGTRAALAARLLSRGWPIDTPSAVLLGAATTRAWTWKGPLDQLEAIEIPPAVSDLPGTIVIGHVVAVPIVPLSTFASLASDSCGAAQLAAAAVLLNSEDLHGCSPGPRS
jgi:uroporphyrin-III C-methyltransferase/precorrin-2 dehydrogenase/sirohydrochlorin ferrochelatase